MGDYDDDYKTPNIGLVVTDDAVWASPPLTGVGRASVPTEPRSPWKVLQDLVEQATDGDTMGACWYFDNTHPHEAWVLVWFEGGSIRSRRFGAYEWARTTNNREGALLRALEEVS